MTAPLYRRAWNIQVLTPAGQGGKQTPLNVSSSDRETTSLRTLTQSTSSAPRLWERSSNEPDRRSRLEGWKIIDARLVLKRET
jgi:hypothetical protein